MIELFGSFLSFLPLPLQLNEARLAQWVISRIRDRKISCINPCSDTIMTFSKPLALRLNADWYVC